MEEKTRVKCEFVGVVNGVPVTIGGRGHVGQGEGPRRRRFDLELTANVVPLGFDPALVALAAADLVLLVAGLRRGAEGGAEGEGAAQEPDDDLRLHAHIDFKLLDENYRDMGGFEIAASVKVDAARVEVSGQIPSSCSASSPWTC